MKALRQALLACLLQYGVTVLVLYFFLTVPPIFGCIGYSDRPGPGCYGDAFRHHFAATASARERDARLRSVAAIFLWPAAVICSILALAMRRSPRIRWVRVVVLGMVGFFTTGYLTVGVGWYMALDGIGVLITALVGAAMAACVAPRLLATV